jgi:hypothetical protein
LSLGRLGFFCLVETRLNSLANYITEAARF